MKKYFINYNIKIYKKKYVKFYNNYLLMENEIF